MLLDVRQSHTLTAADLQQRHKTCPYLGYSFQGRVRRTIRRGETIYSDGQITARTGGRLVQPASIEPHRQPTE